VQVVKKETITFKNIIHYVYSLKSITAHGKPARAITKALLNSWILKYGSLEIILTDSRTNFTQEYPKGVESVSLFHPYSPPLFILN
jgi:hypothetical protein